MEIKRKIQVITAPSILGLKPTGVEGLASALISKGLNKKMHAEDGVVEVETLNHLYDQRRSPGTILNVDALKTFSLHLSKIIVAQASMEKFLLVLGGDCSILIGVMLALKAKGSYGLFFLDGHADFYDPESSATGEAADMDLALVTGRGPDILTNISAARPYVNDQHVVHLGQRDLEETRRYHAPDIRETGITCFDVSFIQEHGIEETIAEIRKKVKDINVNGFWIHFDTDVIEDHSNPAVDYRLSGGLSIEECRRLLTNFITNYNIVGMTVTIYNPALDPDSKVAETLTGLFTELFH
jgi:arginase